MPRYLNHRALLQCNHGGTVLLLPPPFRSLNAMSSPVVTDGDLLEAMVVGCPQVGPGIKPCTKIVSILLGQGMQIKIDSQIPILDSLKAITDGNPPGIVAAKTDGESNAAPTSLQASALASAARSGAAFCEP